MTAGRLDGRVLVVTGGTHGLGAAIAARAARLGAAGIVISGRDATRGDAVAAELQALGCDAVFVAAADAGAPSDAALVTGSVIDFDQTVHGSLGEHVAPAQAGAST